MPWRGARLQSENTTQQILTDGHIENYRMAKKPFFRSLNFALASWLIGMEAWVQIEHTFVQYHHHFDSSIIK